jgi:hypothetical protein
MNNGQGKYVLTAQSEIESISEPIYQVIKETTDTITEA